MPLEIQIHHHLYLPNPHLLNTPGSKATFPFKEMHRLFPIMLHLPVDPLFLLQSVQKGTDVLPV